MIEVRSYSRKVLASARIQTDIALVDIEAVKVSAKNWPIKTRFRAFMVGIGFYAPTLDDGIEFVTLIGASDDEAELMAWVTRTLAPFSRWGIYATRDFDRYVLEGRWTYARRALSPLPGEWPHIEAEERWVNLRTYGATRIERREADVFYGNSKAILAWPNLDREAVWNHNRLDVEEMAEMLERIA